VPVRLNLHLSVPEPWTTCVRQLAREFAALGSPVDLSVTLPHVTVYMASFPEEALENMVGEVSALAAKMKPIAARVGALTFRSSGYVFLDIDMVPELRLLHVAALERLSPLRRGLVVESDWARAASLPSRALHGLQVHGSPWVGDLYAPHITVGKLLEHPLHPGVDPPRGPIVFPQLGLGLAGEHGVVLEVVVAAAFCGAGKSRV
jgi:hypothetical protein